MPALSWRNCDYRHGVRSRCRKFQTNRTEIRKRLANNGQLRQNHFMNCKKCFRFYFIVEVLLMIAVTIIFRVITDRQVAGLVAGTLFVLLGAALLVTGLRRAEFRRTPTFVMGLLHLFFTSVPMIAMRAWHFGEEFSELRVWGLPGPVFHHVSELVYLLLMIATAYDWYKSRRMVVPGT